MSLPKEPRQKMINVMYLVLTALLALNVSSEILNAFKTVNKSLENSNTAIDSKNKTLFVLVRCMSSLYCARYPYVCPCTVLFAFMLFLGRFGL